MRRLKVNTIFLIIITGLCSIISVGYSVLSQAVTVGGDVSYNSGYLYSVFEKSSNSSYVQEYTGAHQDSMAGVGSEKIYHWYASNSSQVTTIKNKDNVIFANHCWKMIRTTDTGGVKMIYNGESENGMCLTTRGNHPGYNERTITLLNSNYWYGTSYIYDKTAGNFKISGTTEQTTWNATTGPNLIGKYTCKLSDENGTCTTLYYVESYYNASQGYVFNITNSSHYSQYGTVPFNSNINSIAHVGYMYNSDFDCTNRSLFRSSENVLNTYSISTSYWYADSISYDSSTNKYSLVNPYQITSASDYPNLVGKYTFRNTSSTYTGTSVYYINAVDSSTMYIISIYNGNDLNSSITKYNIGDSYIDNGNGTYTINNPTVISRLDWFSNYNNYKDKYACSGQSSTCSSLRFINTTDNYRMFYYSVEKNYKFSNSFTYDGTKYNLDNNTAVTFWNVDQNIERINNAHYTCFNESGVCSTLGYVYSAGTAYEYISLSGGRSIQDILNEMLYAEDVNSKNSLIKTAIDAWYERYLLDYSNYLEDTIFCNDRVIRNLGGFNPNGGEVNNQDYLRFRDFNDTTIDLSCTNITDRFSVSNSKAKLTYKIGLSTVPEMLLSNNLTIGNTGKGYWLGNPGNFSGGSSINYQVNNYFYSSNTYLNRVNYSYGMRPTISLIPNIKYISGDGSADYPYVIDTN